MSKEKLRPVGRIDFLDTKGQTGESCYYYSEEDFLKTVKKENYYGVPMVVNVFRDEDGQTIPLDFVQDFDPLPQGFKILDYEMLIREYIPHADNGNTEIRIRQIATDMNELAKVYEIPSMFNEIEIFTKPILKTAMDCIRLINYLERKEKPCKESKH